jgi:glycosyltransferase involved in cell wall biosynthesis
MEAVYFTICSANYLHYARSLHQSLRKQNSDSAFICFLVDEILGRFDPDSLDFQCIEMRRIGCHYVFDMAARYSIMEMNTAIKPFCFEWLFENRPESRFVFLDPDIFVMAEMAEIENAFDEGAAVVITPHSLAPLNDGRDPDDIRLMRTGAYNLGFVALRRCDEARRLLRWWGKQLLDKCVVDLEAGLFVDQKFFDLVPSYFEDVHILRHPGYNVAYWNLAHRKVEREPDGKWIVNGVPLVFFHFSGVVPSDPTIFSKHQNRFTVHQIGAVRDLVDNYIGALQANSTLNGVRFPSLRYAYDTLADGLPFTDDMRRVYGELYEPLPVALDDAFSSDLGRYLTLHPRFAAEEAVPLTRLVYAIWKSRPDLRETFPISQVDGREGLVSWFLAAAERDHRIPASVVEATRDMYALLRREDIEKTGLAVAHDILEADQRGTSDNTVQLSWVPCREITASKVGVGIIGHFLAESGLGAAVRQNFDALARAGEPATAYYMPAVGFEENVQPTFPVLRTTPTEDCLLLHVNADSVGFVETFYDPTALRRKHRIGYWAWELASMPIEWVGAYGRVDEIWAPSRFSAAAFAQRTNKPVFVMPHPVEVPQKPDDIDAIRHRLGIVTDRFVFLTAFDLNSYMDRKNPEAVIEAFESAFEQTSEAPLLAIKLHGLQHRQSRYVKLLDRIARNKNIVLFDRVFTNAEISDLQWCCDAFVSLHRSEGFGLWIAECMARGKSCIVTNYSGNTDFTSEENSVPIGFSMIKVEGDQYPYGEGQWWADPNLDEAVAAMRKVVSDSALVRRLSDAARDYVAVHLSPEQIGRRMRQRLYQARAELLSLPPIRVLV